MVIIYILYYVMIWNVLYACFVSVKIAAVIELGMKLSWDSACLAHMEPGFRSQGQINLVCAPITPALGTRSREDKKFKVIFS